MGVTLRLVAALLAVVMLAGACGAQDDGQVRTFLDATYERVDNGVVQGARDDTRTYRSTRDVAATAAEVEQAVRPIDTARNNEAGTYLQYSNSVVAVQPAAEGGGAIVTLDDDAHARRRFPFIVPIFIGGRGGLFGGGGGSGTFRGGGPGSGK